MKNLLIAIVVGTVILFFGTEVWAKSAVKQQVWFTDWKKASDQAQSSQKALFALFTGSDWCPWCVKLQREILSTKEFKKFAGEELVLFKADFTRNPQPDPALKKINATLMRQFGVQGFPTVILLSPSGETMGQIGYMRGGPDPFLRNLKNILKKK